MRWIVLALALLSTSAIAETQRPRIQLPIDPLGLNEKVGSASGSRDILGALDDKVLPDLKYAKALADKSDNKITSACYGAWIELIERRKSANLDDQGNPLPLPTPHIITDFEKAVELRNALQPTSDFMRSCAPVAGMVRRDIFSFIGLVLGGGAGLASMIPGL